MVGQHAEQDIFRHWHQAGRSWGSERPVSERLKTTACAVDGFFNLAMAPAVESSRVWHYTDEVGAIGIIASGTIRASSISMLNDETEIHYGLETLRRAVESLKSFDGVSIEQIQFATDCLDMASQSPERSDLFSVSASTEHDSLSQWRGYGGRRGYALGLSPSSLRIVSDALLYYTVDMPAPRWGRVLYKEHEQIELALRTMAQVALIAPDVPDRQITQQGVGILLNSAPFLKHPAFSDEREARVVFRIIDTFPAIKFRSGTYGITPYVEASGLRNWRDHENGALSISCTHEKARLPLTAVKVGPTSDASRTGGSLRTLLRRYGYMIEPTYSMAPLRQ